ncbi:MAG: glutamate racemase [Chloroflexi bacterium]|nr:glutamate racemase [Chloroflexota bacterium]
MGEKPLGVFDSGVGGLSVLREIRKLMPMENIDYYADSAHFPYGDKTTAQIEDLALEASAFLLSQGAKLIVVACNTASSVALTFLRSIFSVPFVGMVPAVRPASLSTSVGRVGVMATAATVQAKVFAELLAQFAQGIQVFTQPCPGIVELVERGEVSSPRMESLLRSYLEPLLLQGIDALVLGCTHFVFVKAIIQEIVGEDVVVIDTGEAVSRQVQRTLIDKGWQNDGEVGGRVSYFVSGDGERWTQVVRDLFDRDAKTVSLNLMSLPGNTPKQSR